MQRLIRVEGSAHLNLWGLDDTPVLGLDVVQRLGVHLRVGTGAGAPPGCPWMHTQRVSTVGASSSMNCSSAHKKEDKEIQGPRT